MISFFAYCIISIGYTVVCVTIGLLLNKILHKDFVIKKVTPYETLCNNHNQIIFNLKKIKEFIKNKEEENNICDLINETRAYCMICKKQGQRMENRLRKYVSSIEKLNFKRVRK